jgi:hypothetical protein
MPRSYKPSKETLAQGKDGTTHITYYDKKAQASFVWDGKQDKILVSIGGYAEPVHHTIPAPDLGGNNDFSDNLSQFTEICKVHAKNLNDNPQWDEKDWYSRSFDIKHYVDIRERVT